MRSSLPNRSPGGEGFSIVELMIAVGIIVLIVALAVPSWQRARKHSQTDQLINELRVTADAFQLYAAERGGLPASASTFGAVPTGMDSYLPKNSTWRGVSPTGGYWVWWNFYPFGVWGFSGIIGVYNPKLGSDQLAQIDSTVDDADPNTGGIHTAAGWVFYGIP